MKISNLQNIKGGIYHRFKRWRWRVFSFSGSSKILFVFGCNRSGKSLLMHLFNCDPRIITYWESSPITNIRLLSKQIVETEIQKYHAPISAIKLPAENQNASLLLNSYKNSKSIWVYRGVHDAVYFSLKKFSGQAATLQGVISDVANWRSENVTRDTKNLVKNFYSPTMRREDANALFWYCRNILYFEQGLEKDNRVMLCNYEKLVSSAQACMRNIYSFLELSFPHYDPSKNILNHVGAGSEIKINSEILSICESLFDKLNCVEQEQ